MSALHQAAAAATTDDPFITGPGLIAILVIAVVIGYIYSLHKNPWRKCHRCGGKPARSGWFFWWSRGACECCAGTGRHLRWGRRIFFSEP